MDEIRQALADPTAIAARASAHSLQGSSRAWAPLDIARASEELQKLARSGHWIAAQAVFADLEMEVARLYSELSTLLHTVPC